MMFNKKVAKKIDVFIKEKFPFIYEYDFDGLVLLHGGAIRSLVIDDKVNDLDIAILTQGKCQIKEFIKKFNLTYYINAGGGYKIVYNDFSIDIFSWQDIMDIAIYDIDYICYDIIHHSFIDFGARTAIDNRTITEVNHEKKILSINKIRLIRIIDYVKILSGSNDKVKVNQNKLFAEIKIAKSTWEKNLKKLLNNNLIKCFRFLDGCKISLLLFSIGIFLKINLYLLILFKLGRIILSFNNDSVITYLFILLALMFLLNILYGLVRRLKIRLKNKVSLVISNKVFCDDEIRNKYHNYLIKDINIMSNSLVNMIDLSICGLSNIILIIYIYYLDVFLGVLITVFLFKYFKMVKLFIRKSNRTIRDIIYNLNIYVGSVDEFIKCESNVNDINLRCSVKNKLLQVIMFVILTCYSIYIFRYDLFHMLILLLFSFKYFMFDKWVKNLLGNWLKLNYSCARLFRLIK